MRIRIDKASRIVLPKAVRKKDGFLVVSATVDEDLSDAVNRMREDRISVIASTTSNKHR